MLGHAVPVLSSSAAGLIGLFRPSSEPNKCNSIPINFSLASSLIKGC